MSTDTAVIEGLVNATEIREPSPEEMADLLTAFVEAEEAAQRVINRLDRLHELFQDCILSRRLLLPPEAS
jgi:hypothetical protein